MNLLNLTGPRIQLPSIIVFIPYCMQYISTSANSNNNRLWESNFIAFLIIRAFFMLSLFVGVIVEDFYRLHEIKGQRLITEAQQQWAATQ